MVADLQALSDNAERPEKVRENVLEVALDNLACGLDPKKTTLFIQSRIPEISELTVLFLNLVTLARLKRNPTVKDEMQQKGFGDNVPVGFLAYPISQAADILFCKANVVPVGEDQLPVLEQANEIVRKFNSMYGDVFPEIEHVQSDVSRLVGIDGNAKASKSLDNAIYLDDDEGVIEKKVMSMYTDPSHTHADDPGHVEGNVVFTYLDAFHADKKEVAALKERYQKGGLGDVEIKKTLLETLEGVIAPIRVRRRELAKNPDAVMKILEEGSEKALERAHETMHEVKKAVRLDYF